MKINSKKKPMTMEYLYVLISASLIGFGYNMFLLPSKLAADGISGVSTISNEMYHLSPAFTQASLIYPFSLSGGLHLGRISVESL